jgi:hypothetical protein
VDLLTLGAVIALSLWAKRLSRRPGAPQYLARVWLVLAAFWGLELAGFVGTIATLVHAFHAVDSVAPERKAKTLADGIACPRSRGRPGRSFARSHWKYGGAASGSHRGRCHARPCRSLRERQRNGQRAAPSCRFAVWKSGGSETAR